MENKLDFDDMQNLIDRMYKGDIEAILLGLNHNGCLFRINAIISIHDNDIKNEEVIRKVQSLKDDNATIDSISVGDYARALLDLYGVEKYNGNKKYVKNMIESDMDI